MRRRRRRTRRQQRNHRPGAAVSARRLARRRLKPAASSLATKRRRVASVLFSSSFSRSRNFSSCSSSTASPSKVPFHPPRALRKSAISRVKKVKKRKANYSGKKFSPFVFRVSKWKLFPLFSSEKVKPCVPLHDALIHTASLSVVVVLYHPYF